MTQLTDHAGIVFNATVGSFPRRVHIHFLTYYSTDDIFICTKCDASGGVEFGDHKAKHPLVKCQQTEPEEEDESSDDRLSKLEVKFATMDDRLSRLDSKVDDRLRKVEDILHSVLGKLGDGNV
jgi:hypothetical protein